jgi:multicomponent Na+:H+ antiporter subunit D
LVFLGGLAGFALTGDLFNLFVFFEVMSVSAYALTAYRIERPAPLQGALGFAVTNTVGAMMILFGIALLYGRTGALNMAQVGAALATRPADGLVIVAFALIVGGFLVKAAIVPFHFWLADAYAVAPTPAVIVFTGVMSDLGIYAVARIYWTVFQGPLGPHADGIRVVLVGFAVLTALLGAVMCLFQANLKRLLAFATISQVGLAMIGGRPAHAERPGGRGAVDPRRRPASGRPLRLSRHLDPPLRQRSRTSPTWTGWESPSIGRRALHRRRRRACRRPGARRLRR